MSKVRKKLLLDTNNNLERPKCIKKEWEVKWRGRERILCEPVRDVGAMHDFDNSVSTWYPGERSHRQHGGFQGIALHSWEVNDLDRDRCYARLPSGGRRMQPRNHAHWYFHRSLLIATCHEYRGGNDWKTFWYSNNEIYEYFHHGIGDVSNPRNFEIPPLFLDLKKFFEHLKLSVPEFQRISLFSIALLLLFPRIGRRSWFRKWDTIFLLF